MSVSQSFSPVSNRFDPAVSDAIATLRAEGWHKLADKVLVLATQKAILPPERFTLKNMGGAKALSITMWDNPGHVSTKAAWSYISALDGLGLAKIGQTYVATAFNFNPDQMKAADKLVASGNVMVVFGVSEGMRDYLQRNPKTLRTLPEIFGWQGGPEVPRVPAAYQLNKPGDYKGYAPPRC